ncbi:MAG: hypothetical protein ABF461_03945 [Zymomonas mobilis subsp. pomaceae]|uniref:Uncharacterized protein n=1 Tax=Zymomonas mobilis subsp. pomaceae (strain ATCC 29192 / DSM 22645 / JCM 10191 / CCUG 17912 / NBRC 13757 / NCIMB 11200 / NRRL B-4491 / Barker I) TaxID=579138 RepID=F8ETG4_ZYMMT|nr:hypothetical protein [Zymomonas mobilis]AEI37989.1 hypothetical protein Zymop_1093 [Zymomonas mobilis subsp. pomaceae ATCC 29192]MDX5949357.1 hypothetical protein [Zymomonas mobilis subsp. pomaceae]GEB89911.1 hypothetical protein ZMO02_15480 [Zymomonas mobilis subsp. pomaceae]
MNNVDIRCSDFYSDDKDGFIIGWKEVRFNKDQKIVEVNVEYKFKTTEDLLYYAENLISEDDPLNRTIKILSENNA